MENYLTQITNYLLTQSWQIAILVAVIAVVTLALKNRSAHIRYLLWLIVLAKCLVPPLLTIPLAILPQEQPVVMLETLDTVVVESPPSPSAPVTTPAAPTITERPARLTTRQWLVFGWIAGVAVFLLFAVTKALRTNSWLRRQRKPIPVELRIGIENLFSGLGIKTFPKVWLLSGIGQPFVWGLLRGGIYLPAEFVKFNSAEQRRGILGHELGHIVRFDAAVNILQITAQAIFWFHPFVWWANKKIRAEREKCCDEMAIAHLGAKAKDYSSAIVQTLISEHESTRPVPSLAVAGPVKNIEERIKTMLRPGKKFYRRPSLPVLAIAVLTALLAVPTTVVLTARADADRTFRNPTNLGMTVNSSAREFGPSISADGLSLYFNSFRPGGSGGTDLWMTTRKTKADPWGTPMNLGPTVNSSTKEGGPSISADGLSLYFSSDRPGGYGAQDLWVTTRKSKDDSWDTPVNLGPTVNSSARENGPSISIDGLSLYFSEQEGTRGRPGGLGKADIWVTTRKTKDDPWGTPVNLGPKINGPYDDCSPCISTDGLLLYFQSTRPGYGEPDIWVTTRKSKDEPWGTPINLGPPVSSSYIEYNPDISRDGSTLYFVSFRRGTEVSTRGTDIWQVSLKAKAKPASVLLQEGLYAEEIEGDLDAAIQVYERILKDFPKNRPVAAKALLHIGLCYEKLGKQEAQKAYQRVIKEYADQPEPVRIVREQMLVPPESPKDMCMGNLKTIGKAIERYRKDHGDVPDGLSDLYPDYLQNPSIFLCPADRTGGTPLGGAKDPKMRYSYYYLFGPGKQGICGVNMALPIHLPLGTGMTWKEAKKLQMEYYGPVVPIIACPQHSPPLFLSYDGEIIEASWWEESPRAGAGLLNQLKATMQSTPATWAQRYDMQRFLCLLRDTDQAALAKLLETHIKEHPSDDTAKEFLAQLPKLRFIHVSEDDAQEVVENGLMWLDEEYLGLIHGNDPSYDDDMVVGLRFRDIPIPQGARVKRAYVQFTAYPWQPGSRKTDLVLHAELGANAKPFTEAKHNITSRRRTATSVK